MKMTKRNYFLCISLMFVVIFIFMFVIVTKEYINRYDINSFAYEIQQNRTRKSEWMPNTMNHENSTDSSELNRFVIYIGKGTLSREVEEWSKYRKWNLECYEEIKNYKLDKQHVPEFIVVDSKSLVGNDIWYLQQMKKEGISLVFSGIPPISVLEKSKVLREIIGIREIVSNEIELTGIKLFSDFLLGGETHYIATNKEEEKKQDMQLDVPWFLLKAGAKTYMVGMLEDETIENEDLPPIIWRYATEESSAYVVNGNYMEDSTGMGILDAIVYEENPYTLYSIVNAQNLTVSNFPMLASENNQKMIDVYSRSQKEVFRDIVWPGLVAVSDNSQLKLTCMLGTELDDRDCNDPKTDELEYYLKLMKEQDGELGISLNRITDTSLLQVLDDSNTLLEKKDPYTHTALYVDHIAVERMGGFLEFTENLDKYKLTSKVQTITTDLNWPGNILSFVSDDIVLQATTIDGVSHTYREDFRVRSLETSLGYSNILLDAKRVAWPKEKIERWENMYDIFSRFTDTYWKPYKAFESTTLSESDKRIRDFLCSDYEHSRTENTINLNISNMNDEGWFLLRTHGEKIKSIEGGDYIEVEKNAYIIRAIQPKVEIKLESVVKGYYTE